VPIGTRAGEQAMKQGPKAFVAMTVVLAAGLSAGLTTGRVAAQELSSTLPKAEVTPLVVGKTINYIRKRDNARQSYEFQKDDTVYFKTSTTLRNMAVSGSYVVEDDGRVCFKWNHDKFIPMTDGCIYFRHAGDKLVMVGRREPDLVFGEVVAD
jgi:hypothetical protein